MIANTFKIIGKSRQDISKAAVGTAFIIGRPKTSEPGQAYYVMVTAGHVLDDILGDDATLILRKLETDGTYKRVPLAIKIRENGRPLFVRHPDADVVAMYLRVPLELKIPVISTELLADDDFLRRYEIHPGDELLCLGYPFTVEANPAGFPILRSGKIASFPIVPAKEVKAILFDFQVFPGNSGGPVYMSYLGRVYQNSYHIDERVERIAGLVSQQANAPPEFNNEPLLLALVVPAQFIKETIDLLPNLDVTPAPE